MNEKQITKLIGASIFAVLFLWGVYVFSGYYSQWQEKKAQQEQHTREQMAEQYMSSYTEKLQKTLEKAGLEGVEVSYQYDKYSGSTPEYDEYGREIEDDEDTIGFNEKFIFDDLVISFGSEYEFVSVENTITGINETQAIKIPITITNIGNKSSKMSPLVYEVYTPFNKTAKNINAYFEDNIDSAQELKEGESYTKYIYVLYDGDGAYKIKFTNQNKEIIIKLEISKNKV